MLSILKLINLALAFFMELFMLAAIAYWGFHLKQSWPIRIIAGVGLPLLFVVLWSIFLSPKAAIHLTLPLKMAGKIILFGSATLLLYNSGRSSLAIGFATVTAINLLLLALWKQ